MNKHSMSRKVRCIVIGLLVFALLSWIYCVPQNTMSVYAEEQTKTAELDAEGDGSGIADTDDMVETVRQDTSETANSNVQDANESERSDVDNSANTSTEVNTNDSDSNEEDPAFNDTLSMASLTDSSESADGAEGPTDGSEDTSGAEGPTDGSEDTSGTEALTDDSEDTFGAEVLTDGSENINGTDLGKNVVYVDGVNGSDEQADGSIEHPYRTLSAASVALSAGGSVLIEGTITADAETSDDLAKISEKNGTIGRAAGFGDTLLSVPSGVSVNISKIEISGEGVKASSPLVSVDSGGSLTIGSGAVLTGNNNVDPDGKGGAVYNSGTLILEGGTIENSASAEGAGIYNAGSFTMKDGSISNNTATNPESSYYAAGGGLFCSANSDTKLFAGTISGNTSVNGGSMSGGGIYIDDGATVTARDLLITGNDADFEGGGISTCPTGRIDFRYSNSAAVFDNTSDTDADDLHFEKVQNSILQNGMLGGGNENWSPALQTEKTGEAWYTAHPSSGDKDLASGAARMVISGNRAEEGMGGGIRCNGTLNLTSSNPHNNSDQGQDDSGTKTFIKQGEDGTRLAGAVYEITDPEGTVIASVTSDENGILDLNDIPDGSYTVKETAAPYGYSISPETYSMEIQDKTVHVQNSGGDSLSAFTDEKADGISIKLDKIGKEWLDSYAQAHDLDNPAIPLGDVEFTLSGKTDGGAEKTITGKTGAGGTLDFGFIPDGVWTLTETYPEGYSSRAGSNSSYTFTVKDGVFVKGETSSSYISDGYTHTGNNLGVDIVFDTEGDGDEKLSVTNYQTHDGRQGPPGPRNQYFKKDFVTGKVIGGAVYAECDEEGNVIAGTEFSIDESGSIKPHAGAYYREVTPPDGYLLDPSIYQVVGGEGTIGKPGIGVPGEAGRQGPNQQLINVTTGEHPDNIYFDIPANSFGIVKEDAEDGTALEGVSFLLSNDNTSIEKTTDSNGKAMFYNIPEGVYTLTETGPLKSYCNPDGNWIVTVKGSSITVADKDGNQLISDNTEDYGLPEYTIRNTKIKETPVRIRKISADTGRRIVGAVFHVSGTGKDSNNQDVSIDQEYTTDSKGYISLDAPYNGTVTIKEISNPGYVFENQNYTITTVNGNIDSFQSSSGLYSRRGNEIVIKNELAGTFNIRKIDSVTGNKISGRKVTFFAYGQDSVTGTKYSQRVTSDTGTVSFAIIDDGVYYIREILAPDGYVLDRERFRLVVKDGIYTLTDANGIEIRPDTDENGVTVYKIANSPVQKPSHQDSSHQDSSYEDSSHQDHESSSGTSSSSSISSTSNHSAAVISQTSKPQVNPGTKQPEEADSQTVKTGDDSSVLPYFLLMSLSGAALLVAVISRHERGRHQ